MAIGQFMPMIGGNTERVILIDRNHFNVNLRTSHDHAYGLPESHHRIICIIEPGVIIGSASVDQPAFDVGSWPAGVEIDLIIQGRIQGKGGNGGVGPILGGTAGENGGPAFYTRFPVTISQNSEIWGGGGGGAGSSFFGYRANGGGGQGYSPGSVTEMGRPSGAVEFRQPTPGTTEARGIAGRNRGSSGDANWNQTGGDGGAAGEPGLGVKNSTTAGTSQPGAAIDGNSFVTFTGSQGSIRGPRIN